MRIDLAPFQIAYQTYSFNVKRASLVCTLSRISMCQPHPVTEAVVGTGCPGGRSNQRYS